jgi:methylphosphotriester-DNA--protein-cysteine methyltransferase
LQPLLHGKLRACRRGQVANHRQTIRVLGGRCVRDYLADGTPYYAVKTAEASSIAGRRAPRVYHCRNMRFYATCAGRNPPAFAQTLQTDAPSLPNNTQCRRCTCRVIETADSVPTLTELAQQVGLGTSLHRVFQAVTGLRAVAAAHRGKRVRENCRATFSDCRIFDAGSTRAGVLPNRR